MVKLSFVGHEERIMEILALVCSDICSPFDMPAIKDFSYFIIFIDDFSWYGYVYLMRRKSEAFEKFKKFRHEIEK